MTRQSDSFNEALLAYLFFSLSKNGALFATFYKAGAGSSWLTVLFVQFSR
jgi:hypothetical protein